MGSWSGVGSRACRLGQDDPGPVSGGPLGGVGRRRTPPGEQAVDEVEKRRVGAADDARRVADGPSRSARNTRAMAPGCRRPRASASLLELPQQRHQPLRRQRRRPGARRESRAPRSRASTPASPQPRTRRRRPAPARPPRRYRPQLVLEAREQSDLSFRQALQQPDQQRHVALALTLDDGGRVGLCRRQVDAAVRAGNLLAALGATAGRADPAAQGRAGALGLAPLAAAGRSRPELRIGFEPEAASAAGCQAAGTAWHAILRCLCAGQESLLEGAGAREGIDIMAQTCELCGKRPAFGRNISHAHNVTPRRFNPNLQTVRAVVNGGTTPHPRVHALPEIEQSRQGRLAGRLTLALRQPRLRRPSPPTALRRPSVRTRRPSAPAASCSSRADPARPGHRHDRRRRHRRQTRRVLDNVGGVLTGRRGRATPTSSEPRCSCST